MNTYISLEIKHKQNYGQDNFQRLSLFIKNMHIALDSSIKNVCADIYAKHLLQFFGHKRKRLKTNQMFIH